VRENNDDRRWRMLDRVLDDPSTIDRVVEWLRATSALRDRLIIGEDETYYLAHALAEHFLFDGGEPDPELLRLGDEMNVIGRAHGLEDGAAFDPDDEPPEWRRLSDAWDARVDHILAELMRAGGLADVARVYVEQRARFDERSDEGRRRIWGDADFE
jgi:hypothetical protein